MKKLCTIIILIVLFLNEISCTNQIATNTQSDFSLRDKKMGFTKDDYGKGYISFEYTGNITNETKNIYKEVVVTMVLHFTLENGQVLTDVDMAAGKKTFGAAEAFDIIQMYQPDSVYNIKDLKTEIISTDYVKYPIKSVTLDFTLEYTDEINNSNGQLSIKSEDITQEWKNVVDGNIGRDFHEAEIDSINATIK